MTEIIYSVMLAVSAIWGLWLRFVPFSSIVQGRRRIVLRILYLFFNAVNLGIIAYGIFATGKGFVFNYFRYGILIYSFVTAALNVMVIKKRFREHLFVFGVVLNCQFLMLYFPNCIINELHITDEAMMINVLISVYVSMIIATYFPMSKLISTTVEPFLGLETGKYWNSICLIPILFFATKFINVGGEHNLGGIGQLLSAIISGVIMVVICINIANDHRYMANRLETEKLLTEQKMHYTEMQASVANARKQRHDLKHHLAAVRRYIELDDKEGLSHFCDELAETNELNKTSIPYTGNIAVDGVVYRYMQLCRENKVEFSYGGVVRGKGIADIDLCVLLGNALDNALAASLTIPEGRCINVLCQSEEALLTIVVRNNFDGNIEVKDDQIISLKRGDRPGIGLSSMKSICDRYNGTMETSWDDKSFNLIIMLPFSN